MLFKEISTKVAIVGIAFGLIASPLAMAQSSIELNQDRSAGQDVIDKPQSQLSMRDVSISSEDLTYDVGDGLDYSPSSRASNAEQKAHNNVTISPKDLTRDEGDSLEW